MHQIRPIVTVANACSVTWKVMASARRSSTPAKGSSKTRARHAPAPRETVWGRHQRDIWIVLMILAGLLVLLAEIGALGATATARALARTYIALADGEELVSRASVERFRAEQVCGRDAVMGVPTRWAVGYSLEPPALITGAPPMHGPDEGAFGHMGAGGQIGFADPSARIAVGFVRNHLENQALPLMGACLVDVLYSCNEGGVHVRS